MSEYRHRKYKWHLKNASCKGQIPSECLEGEETLEWLLGQVSRDASIPLSFRTKELPLMAGGDRLDRPSGGVQTVNHLSSENV